MLKLKKRRILQGKKYVGYTKHNMNPVGSIYDKWVVWRLKEDFDDTTNENYKLKDLKKIHREVMTSIEYKHDGPNDTWKPSKQTIEDGFGDCEDMAIVLFRKFSEYGIGNKCFICGVPGHAFLVMKHDSDYIMYDNGSYTMKPEKMSKVLPYYDVEPKNMFNLRNIFKVDTVK
jgi:predicted transglutaminase-like cysteine proteinase